MAYKNFCLSFIAAFILCTGVQAQESLDLNDSDNNFTPFPSNGLLDRKNSEAVNLLSASPDGYDFVANPTQRLDVRIDPTDIADLHYGNLFSSDEFDDYEIDQSLAVGFTPGAHGVSPSGAATYNVPIQLPSGTNGMEPELAITYNSQGGNGLLGMGWNLTGLSVISRVPKTYYHDGAPDRIQFNSSDRFALDGNRLVDMPDGTYATESETFSQITKHGSAGSGPAWFKVKTKNGMTMEYGNSPGSKYTATDGGEALNWYISKVYDQHGNYMEYIYIEENNQVRIDKIRYTGNISGDIVKQPYNEVQFYYQWRSDVQNSYIGGSQLIRNSYLLRKIRITSEEAQFGAYKFTYTNDELYSFLTAIKEYGGDNQSEFNSTIFQYDKGGGDNYFTWYTDFPEGDCNLGVFVRYFPGDFNGDGVTDLLGVFYDRDYDGDDNYAKYERWAIFINNKATDDDDGWSCSELTFSSQWVGRDGAYSNFNQNSYFPVDGITFHIGDLTGDGIDDIVVGTKPFVIPISQNISPVYYNAFIVNNNEGDIQVEQADETLYFDDHYVSCTFCPDVQKRHAVTFGDFDGDGILEFLGVNTRHMDFKIRSFDGRIGVDIAANVNNEQVHEPYATVGDHDGDGGDELILGYMETSGILNNNETGIVHLFDLDFESIGQYTTFSHSKRDYGIWPHNQPPFKVATDFNGDGISDILVKGIVQIGEEDPATYGVLHYGKGISPTDFVNGYNRDFLPPNFANQNVFYQDVNGDGRTDIIEVFGADSPSSPIGIPYVDVHLSTGQLNFNSFHSYSRWGAFGFTEDNNFDFGDVDGDGNLEMIVSSSNNGGSITIHDLNPKSSTNDRRLLRTKNGFGQIVRFEYQTLANTFHAENVVTGDPLHGEPKSYPLRKTYGGFPIVRWVMTENPLSQKVRTWHEFYGGVAHLQGKGFLGFEKVNSIIANPANPGGENPIDQNRTFSEFELDTEQFVLLPSLSKSFAGAPGEVLGNITAETTWNYSIHDLGDDRFWTRLDETTSRIYPEGSFRKETYLYDFDDPLYADEGNLTDKIVILGQGEEDVIETITTTYEDYFTLDNWHIASLPEKVTVNTQRNAETPLVEQTNIEYNGVGTIKSRTSRPTTNARSKVSYTYNNNPFGLVESKTITGLQPTVDASGVITSTEEINSIITDQYTYSPHGRNTETHTNRYDFTTEFTYYARSGQPKTITDHLGRQSYFEYDGFNRPTKEIDHLDRTTTTERIWNEFYIGDDDDFVFYCESTSNTLYKKIVTDVNNRESKYWYNKFGQQRFHDVTKQFGTVRTSKCYDKRGRLSSSRSPYFIGDDDYKTTDLTYDKFGRLLTRNSDPVNLSFDYELLVDGGYRSKHSIDDTETGIAETDASGRVVKRLDSGNSNTLTYGYQSGGLLKMVRLNGQIVAANSYDEFGRQRTLSDPTASGTTIYQYDAFDNLVFQKDNKNNTFRIYFDEFGRLDRREVEAPGLPASGSDYTYVYYDSGHQNSLLKKETAPGDVASTEYTYDENSNITSATEIIEGVNYTTSFQFDGQGRVVRKEFPETGFAIRYIYDNNGFLEQVTTESGNLIWSIGEDGINARGQLEQYTLGNEVSVGNVYDPEHYTLETTTASYDGETMFSFTYNFNPESGNLLDRQLGSNQEYFEYDDNDSNLKLHRLTGAGQDPDEMDYHYSYLSNGNIQSKDGVGDYSYDAIFKNQVKEIEFEGGVDPTDPMVELVGHQSVTYNYINSPENITNVTNDYSVTFTYGPDDQRRKAVYKDGDTPVSTRFYAGSYEKQIDHENQNNEIRVHYISANGQLVAIYVEDDAALETDEGLNGKMYYPHLDHLGSIIHISDANGEVVETFSFDAWGRPRNPDDLSYDNIPERPDWLWRGYTGHEHLDEFGLINMNGRLYDPVVGRMLSPDNYVPTPDFSQGYNRYSYALNNPLKFTDPDGEHPVLVAMAIGAGVGALQGAIRAGNDPNVSVAGGMLRGAVVGAVGGALSTVGGGTFIANVAWGTAQGALTGGLDAALWGNNIGTGMLYGAATGAVFAAATSGIEAINNASDGYGFGTNEGRLNYMLKNESEWSNLSAFMNDRYGIDATIEHASILDEMNSGKPANERWYGAADYKNDRILLAKDAFQNRHMFKSTVVHEYAHLRLDKVYNMDIFINPIDGSVSTSGSSVSQHKWGFDDAGNLIDGPNGWSNEFRNTGRMNFNSRKAFSFLNDGQFSNLKTNFTKLTGTNPFFYSVPQRFNNKVNLYGF